MTTQSSTQSDTGQSYIGAPLRRREDVRFVTGQGQYLDDVRQPDMLHAAILRSPHAHARVRGIDASAALALDGVTAVFTYADMAHLAKTIPMRVFPLPGLDNYLQTPLSADTVRHAGGGGGCGGGREPLPGRGRAGRYRG